MSYEASPSSCQRRRDEAAAFIDGWAPWTHFLTGTYPGGRSPTVFNRDYRCFRDLLAAIGGDKHVPIAAATGPQQSGTPHTHLLVAVPPTYQGDAARLMRRHWHRLTGGNAQVRRYSPARRAGMYMAGHHTWELDYACPRLGRCRRGPCMLVTSSITLT